MRGTAGTVMVLVVLRMSICPAPQRLIRAVRCQLRMTSPGRYRIYGLPACAAAIGRYGSIAGTCGLQAYGPPGELHPWFAFRPDYLLLQMLL